MTNYIRKTVDHALKLTGGTMQVRIVCKDKREMIAGKNHAKNRKNSRLLQFVIGEQKSINIPSNFKENDLDDFV